MNWNKVQVEGRKGGLRGWRFRCVAMASGVQLGDGLFAEFFYLRCARISVVVVSSFIIIV